ncbi:MAG: hypothetical protein R6X35_14605 [Candidatus Krumholzibacteriia bacterium]
MLTATTASVARGRLGPRLFALVLLGALAAALLPAATACAEDCADLCSEDCACLDAALPAGCGCCLDAAAPAEALAPASRVGGPDDPDGPADLPAAAPAASPPLLPAPVPPCPVPPWSARPAVLVLRA